MEMIDKIDDGSQHNQVILPRFSELDYDEKVNFVLDILDRYDPTQQAYQHLPENSKFILDTMRDNV